MLNLRNFENESFNCLIFDNNCPFRRELSNLYNILIPIQQTSDRISWFAYDLDREED